MNPTTLLCEAEARIDLLKSVIDEVESFPRLAGTDEVLEVLARSRKTRARIRECLEAN